MENTSNKEDCLNLSIMSESRKNIFIINSSNFTRETSHIDATEKIIKNFDRLRKFLDFNNEKYKKIYEEVLSEYNLKLRNYLYLKKSFREKEKLFSHNSENYPFYFDVLDRIPQRNHDDAIKSIAKTISALEENGCFLQSVNFKNLQNNAVFYKIFCRTKDIFLNSINKSLDQDFVKKIIDRNSKLVTQDKSGYNIDPTKECTICSGLINKMFVTISSLIYKLIKMKPSSHWELVWVTVPIVWLSTFLGNCNLNIRAI